ncbi:hypothetical protein GR160_18680 [Flavobacterium sp. Sd200]|uniref:hypothetical protein n=1 Tax=Flavobacterium sp. Sd200 TaxID=2692211 RepID=UPI00136831B0|nr:hypothetical protein [Flavobacterium sp. Sd200]MXN93258.1 hypothetical protein [Flavobacterium sp. Sd200]
MNTQEVPFFSNNCGKIYKNKVVFASHKQFIEPQNIKSISVGRAITNSGKFFTLLPSVFFIIPFFVHEVYEKILFAGAGVGIMILAYTMSQKYTYINVGLINGKIHRFKVWESYGKEAQKFVSETKKLIARRSQPLFTEDMQDDDMVVQNHGVPVVK